MVLALRSRADYPHTPSATQFLVVTTFVKRKKKRRNKNDRYITQSEVPLDQRALYFTKHDGDASTQTFILVHRYGRLEFRITDQLKTVGVLLAERHICGSHSTAFVVRQPRPAEKRKKCLSSNRWCANGLTDLS